MPRRTTKNSEFGYLGNPNVKRDGVETEFSKEDIIEYQKCMQNPAYFAEKYVKIINLDEGLVNFELYPYQEEMFNHFKDNVMLIHIIELFIRALNNAGKNILLIGDS